MERINSKYEKFRDVVMNSNTALSSEFKDLRKGDTKVLLHTVYYPCWRSLDSN